MTRWMAPGPMRPGKIRILTLIFACAAGCGGGGAETTAGTGGGDASTTDGGGGHGGSGHGGGGHGGTGDGGSGAAGGTGGSAAACAEERTKVLGPIDAVSEGAVTVLDEQAGEVFIDATAGGIMEQKENPWIYVSLGARARVDVTDVSADQSQGWDIAIKRPILRANGGDGGLAGKGGAVRVDEGFDAVTAEDAQGVTYLEEDWFDGECKLEIGVGQPGTIKTTFDGWYLYEDMKVLPAPGTWLVRGGDGASVFKLQILDYYSNPDGSPGTTSAGYRVRVAKLAP